MADRFSQPNPARERAQDALPFMTVITACRNAAGTIEQCIQSVLGQTLPGIEHVIIDGGSTDGTTKIIERYAPRLAYWHSRTDRGIAHAFNMGLENSCGQWVLFLNADDYLQDSGSLEALAGAIREHPDADVVYGRVSYVTREQNPRPAGRSYGGPWQWRRFIRMHAIPHPATATSRAYFDRVGRFDESYRIAMDYELFLRGGPGLRAVHVDRVVTAMRLGGASRTHPRQVLNEWYRAVLTHGALSPLHARALFTYFAARSALAGILRPTAA